MFQEKSNIQHEYGKFSANSNLTRLASVYQRLFLEALTEAIKAKYLVQNAKPINFADLTEWV